MCTAEHECHGITPGKRHHSAAADPEDPIQQATLQHYHWNIDIGHRDPDKVRIFVSIMPNSSPSPTFDHLLESSHRDDSNKWSNIGFGEEITQVESIEVNFTHYTAALSLKHRHRGSYMSCLLRSTVLNESNKVLFSQPLASLIALFERV